MAEKYVIDLADCQSAGDIIRNISLALDTQENLQKDIILNLKDFQLNQSQLLSIKSLILSYGSNLYGINTDSLITKQLCEALGILTNVKENEEINNDNQQSFPFEDFKIDTEFSPIQTPEEFYLPKEENEEIKESIIVDKNQMHFDLENVTQLNTEDQVELFDITKTTDLTVQEPQIEEENHQQQEVQEEPQIEGEKRVIGVYTKAYEENSEEQIEEVDFYAPPSDEPVIIDTKETMYINQTLRSGQTIDFDGNIVIIGDCHPGSEIYATGDITIWGVLGGIAHAGIKGNTDSKIRALKMNAVQLRIADCYSRRPDGTNIPYIVKSSTFTPEEARIVDKNIVLFKIV